MKRVNLNPIVLDVDNDLQKNQILYNKNANTGRFTLQQIGDTGDLEYFTPTITEANTEKPIITMHEDSEFKLAFMAFYNVDSPIDTSVNAGVPLYSWFNNDATPKYVYTLSATPIVTDATYNSGATSLSNPVTAVAADHSTLTVGTSLTEVTYTRYTNTDTTTKNWNKLFATLSDYLPFSNDTMVSPNVINTYGEIVEDEENDTITLKMAGNGMYVVVEDCGNNVIKVQSGELPDSL